jgi:hypothetical protein
MLAFGEFGIKGTDGDAEVVGGAEGVNGIAASSDGDIAQDGATGPDGDGTSPQKQKAEDESI